MINTSRARPLNFSDSGCILTYVTVSAKTQLIRTSMCIDKVEIKKKVKLHMLQKITLAFVGPLLKEEILKL